MTQVIIPANATEAEEDAILGAAAEAREGQQRTRVSVEDLDGEIGRGLGGPISHIDDSPFAKLEGEPGYVAGQECYPGTVPLLTPQTETEYLNQGVNGERLAESVAQVKAGETEEHALDESFALAGDDEQVPQEVLDQIDQSREEMKDPNAVVKRTQVAILGNKPSGAAAMLAAGLAASERHQEAEAVEQPKPGNLPARMTMSNAEKKRRAAAAHNTEIKPNKFAIVKLKASGLSIKLTVLRMTNKEVNISKDCGCFAVYSKNSALSMPRISQLPTAIKLNSTSINQETLDWILDQVGETAAFEIRNNRMASTTPTEFVIEHPESTWVSKGFDVIDGQLKLV